MELWCDHDERTLHFPRSGRTAGETSAVTVFMKMQSRFLQVLQMNVARLIGLQYRLVGCDNSYSGGTWFECRTRHRLSRQRSVVVLFSPCGQMSG
jgi:hypothetical protein